MNVKKSLKAFEASAPWSTDTLYEIYIIIEYKAYSNIIPSLCLNLSYLYH